MSSWSPEPGEEERAAANYARIEARRANEQNFQRQMQGDFAQNLAARKMMEGDFSQRSALGREMQGTFAQNAAQELLIKGAAKDRDDAANWRTMYGGQNQMDIARLQDQGEMARRRLAEEGATERERKREEATNWRWMQPSGQIHYSQEQDDTGKTTTTPWRYGKRMDDSSFAGILGTMVPGGVKNAKHLLDLHDSIQDPEAQRQFLLEARRKFPGYLKEAANLWDQRNTAKGEVVGAVQGISEGAIKMPGGIIKSREEVQAELPARRLNRMPMGSSGEDPYSAWSRPQYATYSRKQWDEPTGMSPLGPTPTDTTSYARLPGPADPYAAWSPPRTAEETLAQRKNRH